MAVFGFMRLKHQRHPGVRPALEAILPRSAKRAAAGARPAWRAPGSLPLPRYTPQRPLIRVLVCLVAVLVAVVFGGATAAVASPTSPASSQPSGLAGAAQEWISSTNGIFKHVLFVAAYVIILVMCLPGSSSFDYSAGALFGFATGTLLIALAKGLGALVTYVLVRTFQNSRLGLWVKQRVANRSGSQGSRWVDKMQKGVAQGGFKFCLLARLSPMPAYLGNYALSLAGVPLATYMGATCLGMMVPICTNVYLGTAVASIGGAAIRGTPRSGGFNPMGMVLLGISVLSSMSLAQQLTSYALKGVEKSDEDEESSEGQGQAESP